MAMAARRWRERGMPRHAFTDGAQSTGWGSPGCAALQARFDRLSALPDCFIRRVQQGGLRGATARAFRLHCKKGASLPNLVYKDARNHANYFNQRVRPAALFKQTSPFTPPGSPSATLAQLRDTLRDLKICRLRLWWRSWRAASPQRSRARRR
jgi:hypothetical protein